MIQKQEEINLTDVLEGIILEIINFTSIFNYIDIDKVLISLSSNKKGSVGGLYGKLIPLRFKNGEKVIRYNSDLYRMPEILNNKIEQLYILYFYMPRFFDISPPDKIRVIFHELYHIALEFNGDIRRINSKKHLHGSSKSEFNKKFNEEEQDFFEYIKGTAYMNFLKMNSSEFHDHFNKVTARRFKKPKAEIIKGAPIR